MKEIEHIIEKYGDMLFRICLSQMRNRHDAEDAVQDVFIKLIRNDVPRVPSDEEYLKAWLIRTAINRCRDIQRRNKIRRWSPLDDADEARREASESGEVFEALVLLPEKYRIVISLYYVEGYSVKEISRILSIKESAVKMRMKKGREMLRDVMREEETIQQ